MTPTDDFGHDFYNGPDLHLDSWGAGPFTLRVGKKRFYFTDSDMFGPLLESKDGRVLDRQPIAETHPFWAPYHMWRRLGRKGKKVGRWTVCRWRQPRPGTYRKNDRGLYKVICDPEYDPLGYVRADT
jgi:hypothetical protein